MFGRINRKKVTKMVLSPLSGVVREAGVLWSLSLAHALEPVYTLLGAWL